ncbi:MAG: YlxR family protein [Gracilibacteraceae bacterium]|jgi:predicted RNA-binding protein YlxR (DUF448 family)|nr:YlxR family protein [Gracilibacteraceae bacterium]
MTKVKKTPLRMCVACQAMRPKAELLRVVLAETGALVYDGTGKRNGRGAYVCRDGTCVTAAVKKKRFVKIFGQDISGGLLRELEELIKS